MNHNQAPRATTESSQNVQEMHATYDSHYDANVAPTDEWLFEDSFANAVSPEQQAEELEMSLYKMKMASKKLGGKALFLEGVAVVSSEDHHEHVASPFDDVPAPFEEVAAKYTPNLSQEEVWDTYVSNVNIEPVNAHESVTSVDAAGRFELDHAVKRAPRFSEQILDTDRENTSITYIAGESYGLKTKTSNRENLARRESVTELQALMELYDFLDTVSKAEVMGHYDQKKAQAMLENLTFIGEKEYKEATQGIANAWKGELEKNPDLQIYAVAGEIAKSGVGYYEDDRPQIKSDEYMLDTILSNFTDEELAAYEGRIVVNREDVVAKDPNNLKVVLLDDWTISGSQLMDAKESFLQDHPDFEKSIEIQLLVATEERIKTGLSRRNNWGVRTKATPVRAYYMAHSSEAGQQSRAHITGFHSSVDFDFENDIESLLGRYRFEDSSATMPPLTNIVRPYRQEGVKLVNKERLKKSRVESVPQAEHANVKKQSKFKKYMPWKAKTQGKG